MFNGVFVFLAEQLAHLTARLRREQQRGEGSDAQPNKQESDRRAGGAAVRSLVLSVALVISHKFVPFLRCSF